MVKKIPILNSGYHYQVQLQFSLLNFIIQHVSVYVYEWCVCVCVCVCVYVCVTGWIKYLNCGSGFLSNIICVLN